MKKIKVIIKESFKKDFKENIKEDESKNNSNIKINKKDKNDLVENILYFIDEECLELLSYPNYEDRVKDEVEKYLECILPDDILNSFELPLDNIIEYYFTYFHEPRSFKRELFLKEQNKKIIKKRLTALINKEQPEQKSEAWYKYRHDLITASSAWKILDSDSNQNQYIYGKCEPINVAKYFKVNMNSPFHWGNKYEPLSVSLYEHLYKTKIMDFGCIQHDKYNFIGASPDGINVDETSNLYGRMLEIKNIFNREINGIPKREYWIQMQLQMEVCDLDECDFLECRFKEYNNEEEFLEDGTFQKTKKNKIKGVKILFFKDDQPHYEYAPFMCTKEEFCSWREKIMEQNKENNWVKDIYWWLEEYSCVLVTRNREWFKSILPKFENIWKIIIKERKNGYDHRKPKQREKKIKVLKTDKTLLSNFFEESELQEEEQKKYEEKTKSVIIVDI